MELNTKNSGKPAGVLLMLVSKTSGEFQFYFLRIGLVTLLYAVVRDKAIPPQRQRILRNYRVNALRGDRE